MIGIRSLLKLPRYALGSTLEITPMNPLANGQEYNLALRVRSAPGLAPATLEATAPFFVRADSAQGLTAVGNFVDTNGDTVWGSGDVLRVIISRPIGKPSGGFSASLWVNIDLNGSAIIGDGPGELYLNISRDYATLPPDDWDQVFNLTAK